MISLELYVLILLALSAFAMSFIFRVLRKQIQLYKQPIHDKDVNHFRNVLFAISLTIIVMGFIPIIINMVTLFTDTERPDTIGFVSLVYSLGVHLQTLLLSYLLWRIYRLATGDFNDKEK